MRTLFIAGGSASGKTWLADRIAARLPATRLSQDRFYRDRPDSADGSDRHAFDFDRPEAIDWAGMRDALRTLAAGRDAVVPVYDMTTSKRAGRERKRATGEVLVVDGTLVLHAPELAGLWDAAVFVRADEALRRARRTRRDVEERGRLPADIARQLDGQVFPAHDRFVEPSAAAADLVLEADRLLADPEPEIARVLARIAR